TRGPLRAEGHSHRGGAEHALRALRVLRGESVGVRGVCWWMSDSLLVLPTARGRRSAACGAFSDENRTAGTVSARHDGPSATPRPVPRSRVSRAREPASGAGTPAFGATGAFGAGGGLEQ